MDESVSQDNALPLNLTSLAMMKVSSLSASKTGMCAVSSGAKGNLMTEKIFSFFFFEEKNTNLQDSQSG